MWIMKDNTQYVNFIDPKGLRNLDPSNDSKINLSVKIEEIEKKLADTNTLYIPLYYLIHL